MDIAIIGAGNVGRALAMSFTRAGHSVVITSHDPEDAGAVATATRARVATSNAEAAAGAAVVILATPFSSAQQVVADHDLLPDLAGKTDGERLDPVGRLEDHRIVQRLNVKGGELVRDGQELRAVIQISGQVASRHRTGRR